MKRLRQPAVKVIRQRANALLAVLGLVCLCGCASPHSQSGADPCQYNPNTGYPLVGGGRTWHF